MNNSNNYSFSQTFAGTTLEAGSHKVYITGPTDSTAGAPSQASQPAAGKLSQASPSAPAAAPAVASLTPSAASSSAELSPAAPTRDSGRFHDRIYARSGEFGPAAGSRR